MARDLLPRDIEILRKLAPEIEGLICSGSGIEFRSILPPVSRHFARDEEDFARRLDRLERSDLEYLLDAIADGSESLGCMPEEDVEALAHVMAQKVSPEAGRQVIAVYEGAGECEHPGHG